MKTGKIKKSEHKNEWKGPNGVVHYHDVVFEGDDTVWNIGAKDKNPDFLSAGSTMTYEVTDEAKRKIKRVKENPFNGGGGGKSAFDGTGAMVGNSLTNAVTLIAHGKAELKDLEKLAHRICEISNVLKEEFSK